MIFAAGLGTRLKPFTNTKPKALAELNGRTLLEINIKRLQAFGFNDMVVNVHHFSSQVIEFLKSNNNFGANIYISDETDFLLDTGGGLKKAAHFFQNDESILVHNVDVVSSIDLQYLHKKHTENNSLATLACMERKSTREFLIDSNNELCGWRNNQTGEIKESKLPSGFLKPIAFTGIHVINSELIKKITEEGAFSITNVYLRLAKENSIKVEVFKDITWFDLGTPEQLAKAACMKKELGI